ncbi:MAG TPA: hypothetical protein DCW68_04930 [Rhodospirillaceae bacterium]|nr:MAG: hypothetical protein A2018_02715 [Alphaproteobacteria bacterium GWF2_58_20]HAU29440.1 hypothetical protein [Rhodospirillaceae bacterium]
MNSALLEELTQRFENLYQQTEVPEALSYLKTLKYHHTFRVQNFCIRIARDLDWTESATTTAAAIGLLHDVGRFPQLAVYGHMMDETSLDHAQRSTEIVRDGNWLSTCPETERQIVLTAITQHNKKWLDPNLSEESLRFARLIRDADKLDILDRIFDELKEKFATEERTPSPALVAQVLVGQKVENLDITSFPDLLMRWVVWPYEMNYRPSLRILKESGAMTRIFDFLAETDDIRHIRSEVMAFMDRA